MSHQSLGKVILKHNCTYLTRGGIRVHVKEGTSNNHPERVNDFSGDNGKCYASNGIVRGSMLEETNNHLVEEVV